MVILTMSSIQLGLELGLELGLKLTKQIKHFNDLALYIERRNGNPIVQDRLFVSSGHLCTLGMLHFVRKKAIGGQQVIEKFGRKPVFFGDPDGEHVPVTTSAIRCPPDFLQVWPNVSKEDFARQVFGAVAHVWNMTRVNFALLVR